ncbi:HD-GYP domain-containing protein [Baekduia sp.]|uniref:HD-GYP domain-containing protein n=1 Tax=Baekduia sp. TaxID=2600305 RepID=UPI002E088FF2|nr:HD domain-containing phosphohydrolase [Baekduia sp.]
MSGSDVVQRPRLAAGVAAAGLVVAAGLAIAEPGTIGDPLAGVLLACAVVSRLLAVDVSTQRIFVSGAFLCGILAACFLGPAAAFAVPVIAELVGWMVERYRRVPLLINLAGSALPTVAAAVVFQALDLTQDTAAFAVALAISSGAVLIVNSELVGLAMAILDGQALRNRVRALSDLAPTIAINIALVTAIGAVYAQTGFAVITLVLVALLAFSYMTRLVIAARERTKEYANLSWGVLSGLIRTLDARDHRAARHCAAVARFARDIASHVGMTGREQELAHTAGLLHDIGRFALSDRVMERGVVLTEDDWTAIRRHPELGADLLRDIGVYGPLSEIIVAHHERPDGKGYPHRLTGEEIPEIAKIIAVAEVYDTLTAPDTYRTRLSSFEALTELRRVAGTQLDAGYVEALAELLAGQGTEYRHADAADYDEELAIERRMNEAAGG